METLDAFAAVSADSSANGAIIKPDASMVHTKSQAHNRSGFLNRFVFMLFFPLFSSFFGPYSRWISLPSLYVHHKHISHHLSIEFVHIFVFHKTDIEIYRRFQSFLLPVRRPIGK